MANASGKEIILKAIEETKTVIYMGNIIQLPNDFSSEIPGQKKMAGYNQSTEMKNICSQEYSRWQGYHSKQKEKQSCWDKQKLKEFFTTKSVLPETLKETFWMEKKDISKIKKRRKQESTKNKYTCKN